MQAKQRFWTGFYVTKLRFQAENIATRITRYTKLAPVVTEYEFDEYAYEDSDLNVLRFDGCSEGWLDFVVLNRNADKRRQAHDYGIIEGPVADDRITRNITKYLNGKISKPDFLEMLKYSESNHQICFCTVNSLQMLNYVDNPKDAEYEISEVSQAILEQLITHSGLDEKKAANVFYSSHTFSGLADEATKLYLKPWQEIYEMLKKEISLK
jgi:hypothetical protein